MSGPDASAEPGASGRLLPAVILATVMGAMLRVCDLGAESLWLDEASTAWSVGLSYKDIFFDTGDASQLPLYFWISKLWCAVAGTGEAALRTPAVVFGILLIPAVFFLGRELLNPRAGAWAAFLAALNPYLIHYSQEARPYTLLALLTVLNWHFLVRWIRTGCSWNLAGFTAATTGILYTHPLSLLIVPANLAAFVIFLPRRGTPVPVGESAAGVLLRSRVRWLWRSLELSGLLFLPLFYRLLRELRLKLQGGSAGAWLPEPGWTAPLTTLERYFMSPWLALMILGLAGYLALRAIPGPSPRQGPGAGNGRHRAHQALLLTAAVWGAFTVVPWLVSEFLTPVYYHRYTIPVLPLLLILAGGGLAGLAGGGLRRLASDGLAGLPSGDLGRLAGRKRPSVGGERAETASETGTRTSRRLRQVLAVLVVALTALPLRSYYTKLDKPPWRETFRDLNQTLAPGDLLIRDPGWLRPLTDYYFRPVPGVNSLSPYTTEALRQPLAQARDVWVLTLEEGEVGVERILRTGEIPGWTLRSSHPLPEPSRANPRALGLLPYKLARFERKGSLAGNHPMGLDLP